ncbi:MAG TPA: GNAT family N-acetyltransferase [Cyclobacteriaceae bacterium]
MIAVREMKIKDAELIARYFLDATPDFLKNLGVDPAKLPALDQWVAMMTTDLAKPMEEKEFFYVIWLFDNKPIGHSNINKIVFGQEAYMHLHLWTADRRHKGIGTQLLRLSLPYYFRNFRLNELFCEPNSQLLAPNKTLEGLGFEFVKEYDTIPGWINFHQPVKRWRMTKNGFLLSGKSIA